MLTDYQKSLLDSAAGVKSADNTIHLDSFFNQENEMYSNSNMKKKKKKNTFRSIEPSEENVGAPEALTLPESPSAPGAEAPEVSLLDTTLERKRGNGSGFKKLSHNDYYTEIYVQVAKFRNEGKIKRINAYVSLKTDTDQTFSVFLAGSGTTSMYELQRGAGDNKTILDTINLMRQEVPGCMIARLRYKARRGHATKDTRNLLKSAILAIEELNGDFVAHLWLMNELYSFPLCSEMSEKQKQYYIASGSHIECRNMTDDEEFDD